jgi:carbamoyl-phosphate synthase large subunit
VTHRILVPGAGGPGTVNLTRSLLAMQPAPFLVGTDASPYFRHLSLCQETFLVPRASQEDQYLAALNRLIERHGLDFVYPNNSLEIDVLARRRADLKARVFLPSTRALAIANSKWETWQVLQAAGLPVPATRLLEHADDLEAAFRELPGRPLWVRGAGIPGKGIGVASLPCPDQEVARQWVRYWQGWGGMIVSEYLPGDNLTWMGVWDQGRLIASQGRKRIAYVIPHVSPSGITGAPAVSHTVTDARLDQLGERAVLALDPAFTGVAFVDFKGDAANQPRITEINAGRFGTTCHFYTAAGFNFPALMLELAFGREPAGVPIRNPLPPDLYWVRTLDAGPALLTREQIEEGPKA